MRHFNISVLLTLVLSCAICVLIYLYSNSRSQYKAALADKREVQRTFSNLRSERDSLQYDLDNERYDNKQITAEKEKALAEVNSAHAKVESLEKSLQQLQSDYNALEESDVDLQDKLDKAKADLTTFTKKWKQCDAQKKELSDTATANMAQHDKEVRGLRSELAKVSEEKTNTERKLNEIEQSLELCERQSGQAGDNHVVKQAKLAVDDRSVELVPPKPKNVADAGAPVEDVGVAVGRVPVQGNDKPQNHNSQEVNANINA